MKNLIASLLFVLTSAVAHGQALVPIGVNGFILGASKSETQASILATRTKSRIVDGGYSLLVQAVDQSNGRDMRFIYHFPDNQTLGSIKFDTFSPSVNDIRPLYESWISLLSQAYFGVDPLFRTRDSNEESAFFCHSQGVLIQVYFNTSAKTASAGVVFSNEAGQLCSSFPTQRDFSAVLYTLDSGNAVPSNLQNVRRGITAPVANRVQPPRPEAPMVARPSDKTVSSPSVAPRGQSCTACNIVDEGLLNDDLVGKYVYQVIGNKFAQVKVMGFSKAGTSLSGRKEFALRWLNEVKGDSGTDDARSYYTEARMKEAVAKFNQDKVASVKQQGGEVAVRCLRAGSRKVGTGLMVERCEKIAEYMISVTCYEKEETYEEETFNNYCGHPVDVVLDCRVGGRKSFSISGNGSYPVRFEMDGCRIESAR